MKQIEVDAVVIGAGISGLATLKTLKESGFNVVALEKSGFVGGLWKYRPDDYGVMKFTHINVSKYNYCFSDHPFPENATDYPHQEEMANYIQSYAERFELLEHIRFFTIVQHMERKDDSWLITACEVDQKTKEPLPNRLTYYLCHHVAIATGHHATPSRPHLKGEETFTGDIIHSVTFKDAGDMAYEGKNILVVGIGNSAVDVAVNSASAGRANKVYLSTRSGAWIFPNYVFGKPIDLYASRFLLWMPDIIFNRALQSVIQIVTGDQKQWGLFPKMRARSAQATVSPTLLHHIQRKKITILPDIKAIHGSSVTFNDGTIVDHIDHIVLCTGYTISLPYFETEMRNMFHDNETNELRLFKNVFCPSIGSSLGFIGFCQPFSGGILPIAECQARWFTQLCKGSISLPPKDEMVLSMQNDKAKNLFYKSARHTITVEPITYNDEICSYFGAKPSFLRHPRLAWRLAVGSGGCAQWRLQGPDAYPKAAEIVRSVPVPSVVPLVLQALLMLMAGAALLFYALLS